MGENFKLIAGKDFEKINFEKIMARKTQFSKRGITNLMKVENQKKIFFDKIIMLFICSI